MAKSTTKRSPAKRAAAAVRSEERHAPVSLPSGGSYDAQELQKRLDAASDNQAGNREAEVSTAIKASELGGVTATNAPNALPDHRVARVDVMIGQATERDGDIVAGETVTEFRQVYDPQGKASESADDRIIDADQSNAETGQSEVLSLDMVEAAKPSRAKAPSTDTNVAATTGATGDVGTTSNPDAVEASIAEGLAANAADADATTGA